MKKIKFIMAMILTCVCASCCAFALTACSGADSASGNNGGTNTNNTNNNNSTIENNTPNGINGNNKISDAERLAIAISKIYGQSVDVTEIEINEKQTTQGDATILEAYKVDSDGNYIIKSTGAGGYSGGTVTCWVVVKMDGSSISGVGKVVIDSEENQSFISKITSEYLDGFSTAYNADTEYSVENGFVASGASRSSNAICNAVNGAISFVKTAILGQPSNNNDPLSGFVYTKKLYKKGTSGTSYTIDGDTVNYTVKTGALDGPMSFTLEISVAKNSDGKAAITSYKIATNGSTTNGDKIYKDDMHEFETYMVGKTADELLALINTSDGSYNNSAIDSTFKTSATESNYLCLYAGLFATANYDQAMSNVSVNL